MARSSAPERWSPTSAASRRRPLAAVAARVGAAELSRYVGSHPMAGSERSGPLAASAALFDGRPWAITPHPGADPRAVGLVESLVLECGASPRRMEPAEHDRAVARISHLPHLAAVLVAGRLAHAPEEHLALSGQGVRDVTRVAASDPGAVAADPRAPTPEPCSTCSPRCAPTSTR